MLARMDQPLYLGRVGDHVCPHGPPLEEAERDHDAEGEGLEPQGLRPPRLHGVIINVLAVTIRSAQS